MNEDITVRPPYNRRRNALEAIATASASSLIVSSVLALAGLFVVLPAIEERLDNVIKMVDEHDTIVRENKGAIVQLRSDMDSLSVKLHALVEKNQTAIIENQKVVANVGSLVSEMVTKIVILETRREALVERIARIEEIRTDIKELTSRTITVERRLVDYEGRGKP